MQPITCRSCSRLRQAVRRLVFGSPVYRLTLWGRMPSELGAPPPDPWLRDPALATAILDGEFRLAGRRFALGPGPWPEPPPAPEAAAALHGFGWLGDLRAVGTEAARERARQLVGGWIEAHHRWSEPSWRPDVLGERLANWFVGHQFLCAGADPAFAARFVESAARQARHLHRVAASAPDDGRAFAAVRGLIYSGLCVPGNRASLDAGLVLLGRRTDRQVLPDGGHFERCPSVHLDVLRRLVEIRGALAAAGEEVPTALQGAIDRMVPMLRGYRLGDGGLARFNGGGGGDRRMVDAVLAQAGVKGKALSSAPHTGFQRLAAGRTVVLVDTGAPPAAGAHAHAGTLAFEMSVGRERLIVNCGAEVSGEADWRAAARSTAAHSTLCVGDTNSSEILPDGRPGRRVAEVSNLRREANGSIWLEAGHDGYRSLFGLTHDRRLFLDAAGQDFRGEDILAGPEGPGFALRFHLHPRIQASLVHGGSAVLLRLPGGGGWRFRVDGGRVGLEESIHLGEDGAKRSNQIVVSGTHRQDPTRLKWRFNRVDPSSGHS